MYNFTSPENRRILLVEKNSPYIESVSLFFQLCENLKTVEFLEHPNYIYFCKKHHNLMPCFKFNKITRCFYYFEGFFTDLCLMCKLTYRELQVFLTKMFSKYFSLDVSITSEGVI